MNDTFDAKLVSAKLRRAWSSATSSRWTTDNPANGQCSVTALLLHERFGGELLKTRIGAADHFYNRIAGQRVDLTADQFADPITYDDLPATVDEALADTSTVQLDALRAAYY